MNKTGNGDPQVCVANLMKLRRYEVPMDRIRGLDTELYDKPGGEEDIVEDAKFTIDTYEPRVDIESVEISTESGDAIVTANVIITDEEEAEEDE